MLAINFQFNVTNDLLAIHYSLIYFLFNYLKE